MSGSPRITLLSDFGQRDGYVGAMKGVLTTRCAAAHLIDLTHEIAPGDVAGGAWALGQAARWFPAGTVHLAVVDPGVGTSRRALACRLDHQFFVAPDNGLLMHLLARAHEVRVHEIVRDELWNSPVSDVFHGRDVFAPVAAWLAGGGELGAVGPRIDPAMLAGPAPEAPVTDAAGRHGRIVHEDRFGNLISNLPLEPGEAMGWRVEIDGREIPFARTYADVPAGALLALVGSEGCVELACNGQSAAALLGAGVGHVLVLRPVAGADPA